MDFSPQLPNTASSLQLTTPECSPTLTDRVAKAMKKLSKSQIKSTLKISDALATSTKDAWQAFAKEDTQKKPCIFTYSGAAYQGLEAGKSCSTEALLYLQDRLRILSAAYGVLRPFDQIQAYRLEMGTKGILEDEDGKSAKFSDIWSTAVTESLLRDMSCASSKGSAQDTILLNLASDEYSATIKDTEQIPSFIKVIFREPNGRVVAVHAKRARGLMVRYLATHQVDSLEGVKGFDWERYQFQESSSDQSVLVFQRANPEKEKPEPTAKAAPGPVRKRTRTR